MLGYHCDAAATAATMAGDWLKTGDLGYLVDGTLFITGRKKELIVSSTGKKIHPSRVENLFKLEPLVNHILLVGDRLPYLTALFTVNTQVAETLKRESPETPIIMLTGWGTMMKEDGDLPAQVDGVLGKPPKISELYEMLRTVTSQPKTRPAASDSSKTRPKQRPKRAKAA